MANQNSPFGFRAIRHATGGDSTRMGRYRIAAGYATSLYDGDLVKSDGAGNIVRAVAGDAILGIFRGCEYVSQDGSMEFRRHWAASTATLNGEPIYAKVMDDPFLVFEVMTSQTIDGSHRGKFVDMVPAGIVTALAITAPGAGYTDGSVAFSGGGGSNAAAKATFAAGALSALALTNPGAGYTAAPTVTINGNGAGATATATLTMGNPYTGLSQMTIGAPGGPASQFQILDISEVNNLAVMNVGGESVSTVGLSTGGAFSIVQVRSVKHERLGAVAGVAV